MRRIISVFLLFAFLTNGLIPQTGLAQEIILPKPGVMVRLSPEFTPAYLKGMVINPNDPFEFDFIIHRGDKQLTQIQKREEYTKLIKYFLAALAVPDEQQWVNLSPYEKNRIIPDIFGLTEMGRDLLSEDYMLKQITASMIYPEDTIGKKFWQNVYAQAQAQYGTTNIPINTFNKVWIVPDKAVLYEKGNTVYVLESHLKVMLEEDYLSLEKHSKRTANNTHTLASQIVRAIVIPELTKEVNEDQNFAPLRQVFSGMLLATWYKRALKESILGKLYANQGKVKGVDQDPKNNQHIYGQYLQAFKKGVFNLIKEDTDRYTQQKIPRKYFSGGMRNTFEKAMTVVDFAQASNVTLDEDDIAETKVKDAAMTSVQAIGKYLKGVKKANNRLALLLTLFGSVVTYRLWQSLSQDEQEYFKTQDHTRLLALSAAVLIGVIVTKFSANNKNKRIRRELQRISTFHSQILTERYQHNRIFIKRYQTARSQNEAALRKYIFYPDERNTYENLLLSTFNLLQFNRSAGDDPQLVRRNYRDFYLSQVPWNRSAIKPELTKIVDTAWLNVFNANEAMTATLEKRLENLAKGNKSLGSLISYLKKAVALAKRNKAAGLMKIAGSLLRDVEIIIRNFESPAVQGSVHDFEEIMSDIDDASHRLEQGQSIVETESKFDALTPGDVQLDMSKLKIIVPSTNITILRNKIIIKDAIFQFPTGSPSRRNYLKNAIEQGLGHYGRVSSVRKMGEATQGADNTSTCIVSFTIDAAMTATLEQRAIDLNSRFEKLPESFKRKADHLIFNLKEAIALAVNNTADPQAASDLMSNVEAVVDIFASGQSLVDNQSYENLMDLIDEHYVQLIGQPDAGMISGPQLDREDLDSIGYAIRDKVGKERKDAFKNIWERSYQKRYKSPEDLEQAYIDASLNHWAGRKKDRSISNFSNWAMKVALSLSFRQKDEELFMGTIPQVLDHIGQVLGVENQSGHVDIYFNKERIWEGDANRGTFPELRRSVEGYLLGLIKGRSGNFQFTVIVNNQRNKVSIVAPKLRSFIDTGPFTGRIPEILEHIRKILQLRNSPRDIDIRFNEESIWKGQDNASALSQWYLKVGARLRKQHSPNTKFTVRMDDQGDTMSISNPAMQVDPGGIDMNSANLDFQVKRDGNGVPLPVGQQDLQNIHIDGLVPVILKIRPATSSPILSQIFPIASNA